MSRVIDILEAGGVVVGPTFSSFEETVGSLVDTLIANGRMDASLRESAVRAVCERELLSSTVMVEIGVSIPHARLEGVEEIVAAVAVAPDAVYHAMAGVPISIVVLVFSPPDMAGEHLNVLASLSMLLQSENLRRRVASAPDTPAVIEILREQG